MCKSTHHVCTYFLVRSEEDIGSPRASVWGLGAQVWLYSSVTHLPLRITVLKPSALFSPTLVSVFYLAVLSLSGVTLYALFGFQLFSPG